jgi:hypothetical protein
VPVLRVDNKFIISLVKSPVHHDRSKHIDVRYHLIWEYEQTGQIALEFIRTEEQLGDTHRTSRKSQVQRTLQQDWFKDSIESASRIRGRVVRINRDTLFLCFYLINLFIPLFTESRGS